MAELEAEFGRACSGQFRCVVIEGEPGVGKTRLANEFADRSRSRATGLRARGHPLGATEPFGLWSELLDGHLRGLEPAAVEALCGGLLEDLAGLLRTAAAIHGAWQDDVRPGRLREALATLLANLSRQRPVLVVLDDIHLADSSSWEALGYLARALRDAPVLVLVTIRADEIVELPIARHMLFGLEQDGVLARRALHRLDRSGIDALAHRMLGRPSVGRELATWLFERSRGNPLFAIELLEDLLAEDADPTGPFHDRVPRQLSERVAQRLERLDADARDALELLAVLGRRLMPEELNRIDPRSAEAMPALETSGLVDLHTRGAAESWEISHPLIQSAIYDEMAAPRRRATHLKVARMLLSADRLGEAAPHFVRVAGRGDPEAVGIVIRALAQSWRRGAFGEAFAVLGSLVDLVPTGDVRWWDVLDAMPYTEEWASTYNRIPLGASDGIVALREIDETLSDSDVGREDHARIALVNLYLAELLGWCTGELEEAGSRAEAAVAGFRAQVLETDHFVALSAVATSYAALTRGDHERAAVSSRDATARLAGHGYRGLEARCQTLLGRALAPTDRSVAVTSLSTAAKAFDELGATHRREQVLTELSHLGKRGRRATDVLRGPASLTGRERQVVALAVEGLTAKQVGNRLSSSANGRSRPIWRTPTPSSVCARGSSSPGPPRRWRVPRQRSLHGSDGPVVDHGAARDLRRQRGAAPGGQPQCGGRCARIHASRAVSPTDAGSVSPGTTESSEPSAEGLVGGATTRR